MQAQLVTDSPQFLTVEEYIEGEQLSEMRHEYFDGHVFAMAGASDAHELIAMNLAAALHAHLKGTPCQVFKDGMKLRLEVSTKDLFYYPDIMVVCDPLDAHRFFREKPRLLIEVLSEDENKDLVEKYFAYQRIPSLEEYVVVGSDKNRPEIRIFRRAGGWEPGETHRTGEFTLRSFSLTLPVAGVYSI